MITIRPLVQDDWVAFNAFVDALKKDSLGNARFTFLHNKTLLDVLNQCVVVLGAFEGVHLVGYAHLQGVGSVTLGIAVSPQYRGTGIGRQLMKTLMERAPSGTWKVKLRVRDDNAQAIGLYESFGFRPEGYFADEERVDGHAYGYFSMATTLPLKAKAIPWAQPSIGHAEFRNVVSCFTREWYSQGPLTEVFERELARKCDAEYAVAMNNATAALVATAACVFPKNSRIAVPANTHVSCINALITAGHRPSFTDCEPDTGNIDPAKINPKSQGILPVHLAGHPCDNDALNDHRLPVVEDAAQALLAEYKGERIGSGPNPTIISFHAAKTISTIEGGVVVTNDATLAARLRRFRNHGETTKFTWGEYGLNFRFTDLQAAFGLAQLANADKWVVKRNLLVDAYRRGLASSSVTIPAKRSYASFHPYTLALAHTVEKERVLKNLESRGIGYRDCWLPMHRQPAFQQWSHLRLPVSDEFQRQSFFLPIFNDMTREDVQVVCDAIQGKGD